jgi:TPR repeat protein
MNTAAALQNSQGFGTPYYQAPEVIEDKEVSGKIDVYSFGIMIYVVLTGKHPFPESRRPGVDPRKAQQLHYAKVLGGQRPIFTDEPNAVRDLAAKCWDNDPDHRPSFREVMQTLCSREFLDAIPGLDFTVLRDFASRAVPQEIRGFLAQSRGIQQEASLLRELVLVKCRFPAREEDDGQLAADHSPDDVLPSDACRKAAELGDPNAMCEWAISLWLSESDDDKQKAAKLMKQAADRGCGMAGTYYDGMVAAGYRVGDGHDVEKYCSWEDTQNRCQKLFAFATAYHQGDGVDKDIHEAIRLYELAADCGHSESCFALSEIYRTGEDDIPRNPARSILYARRNYEKGLGTKQQDDERDFLGLLSFSEFQSCGVDGVGRLGQESKFGTIPKDEKQSQKLLELAHKRCFAFQQYRYAQQLESGRGVQQNVKKSREYFSLAARHGFPVGDGYFAES